MDQSLKKLLFDIICRSVWGRELPDTEQLSDERMQDLYKTAKMHDLSHILTDGMMKTKIAPESFKSELTKSLLIAVMRYEKQKYTLNEICELFEQHEIPFVPLKGSVIRDYYPQPWMRTSGDIDVLVHKSDCEKAIMLLKENQYRFDKAETMHDYSLYSPSGVQLELHYTLVEDVAILCDNEILNNIWDYVTECDGKSYMKKMPNEVFMLYHVVHLAKHFKSNGCGIRPFLDLWLLEQKMPFDCEKLNEMLDKSGVLKFYNISKQLCSVWFDGAQHNELTQIMEELIIGSGIHGNIRSSHTLKEAKGEKKYNSFLKLVFISRENLEILYPPLKGRPYLAPYYQVKRWLKIFNKQKREKINTISAGIMSVKKDKRDKAALMLEEFGLK